MDRGAISEQIDRILRSQSFANKSQLKKLLEVLATNIDSQAALKPNRVIRELWPEETKTKGSADVATEINRLRHALDAYYQGEGQSDSIIITLPNRAAPAPDGSPEKRWIVANSRDALDERPKDASARLKRGALIIGAMLAFAIVAYISLGLVAHPQPRSGRLDRTLLRIMNTDGKELWNKNFPDGFGPDWLYNQGMAKLIWFGDLEGNGHTSVLFVYSPAAPESHPSTLICYSDRGQEKWRWTPGRNLPELNGSPPTFKTAEVAVLEPTLTRPARIVVSSQQWPWWANQIAILDSNGKVISEYWHSGALSAFALADLDGDGKQEIIAAGIANGYDHQATLVVLDPDHTSGASTEVRPEFQIHGMGVAREKLRLLFPRSDLNQALFQFNMALAPSVQNGGLRVTVAECITPLGCDIWYEFDSKFRLIAAFAGGDEFRSTHNKFFQTGKNAHTLTAEEQAAFLKVRCLVGCKSEYVPVGNLVP